nr:ankyrin repeat family protein [Oriental turtle dovepox virus]
MDIETSLYILFHYLKVLIHPQYKCKKINVLFSAIYDNDVRAVKYLLDRNLNPDDEIDIINSTFNHIYPLITAAALGYTEIVRLLISYKSNVNKQDRLYKKAALHMAVQNNDYNITRMLLENGANPNLVDFEMSTPMHIALLFNPTNSNMVSMLLKYGSDIHLKDKYGKSSIDLASNERVSEEIKMLIRVAK